MKNLMLIGLILLFCISCEEDNNGDLNFIDSLELIKGECSSSLVQSTLCFDTVLTDSRCAEGANCKWEGNAKINLDLILKGGEKHKIELNTNSDFQTDTTIDYLYISLSELTPYPEISMEINPKDYKAKLIIANLDKLESNAKLLSFNPEKCECCWGWTIKMGNDTIKSDDVIIGEKIGYRINYPVNVYLELGELDKTCSDLVGMDYYNIEKIIKPK